MTTTQRNLAARRRDPDLIGAEAAMHRAARRARERAKQTARSAARARWTERLDYVRRWIRSFGSLWRRV